MTKKHTPTTESIEPWLNTSGACHHLSISIPTLRRWVKSGKLNAKRTPTGGLRFRQSDLDQLLA
jgi:excisionase family DNA binding protein